MRRRPAAHWSPSLAGWAQFTFKAPAAPQSTTVLEARLKLTSRGVSVDSSGHVYSFNAYPFQWMDVSMSDLTAPGINDAEIDSILTAYSQPSFPTKFFFAGDDGFYDTNGDGSYTSGIDPQFYDGDGDLVYNATGVTTGASQFGAQLEVGAARVAAFKTEPTIPPAKQPFAVLATYTLEGGSRRVRPGIGRGYHGRRKRTDLSQWRTSSAGPPDWSG